MSPKTSDEAYIASFIHTNIELVDTARVKINPHNARTHSPKQLAKIRASISKFGFIVPIIVDENYVLLAGHGRLAAAMALGLEQVPVVCFSHMSEADKRAYMLADNRIAELSDWDKKRRNEELSFLLESDYKFEVTGFELSDFEFNLGDQNVQIPDQEPEVKLPAFDEIAISRLGDIWNIGPHRFIVGDARDPRIWDLLFASGTLAAMCFADPPHITFQLMDMCPGLVKINTAILCTLAGG